MKEGDIVRVRAKNQWKPAKLIAARPEPRSYDLQMENGNRWRRNRRDIRKTEEPNTIFKPTPQDYEEPQAAVQSPPPTPRYNPPPMTPPKSPLTPLNRTPPPPLYNPPPTTPRKSPPTTLYNPPSPITITRAGRHSKLPAKFKEYNMG